MTGIVFDGVLFARKKALPHASEWYDHQIMRGGKPRMVKRRDLPGKKHDYMELDEFRDKYGDQAGDASTDSGKSSVPPLDDGLRSYLEQWVGARYRDRAMRIAPEYASMDLATLSQMSGRAHDEAMRREDLGETAIRSLVSRLILTYRRRMAQKAHEDRNLQKEQPVSANTNPSLGVSWPSVDGERKVVAVRQDGKLEVSWTDRTSREIISADDLVKRMEFDARQLVSHEKMQEQNRQAAEKEAGEESLRNDTDGFADSMPPHHRVIALRALNKVVRHDGDFLPVKDIVRAMVRRGAMVDDSTDPGNPRLSIPSGVFLSQSQLSKTAIDYARFLIGRQAGSGQSDEQLEKDWKRQLDRTGIVNLEGRRYKVTAWNQGFRIRLETDTPGPDGDNRTDFVQIYPTVEAAQQGILEALRGDGKPPWTPMPEYRRKTPAPGTPERLELKVSSEQADAQEEAARKELDAMKARIGKMKYGSASRDRLEMKSDDLASRIDGLRETADSRRERLHDAGLEDLIQTGDQAQKLAAMAKLHAYPAAEACEQIRELAERHARQGGVQGDDLLRSIGLDVASMISSYPHFNNLETQTDISIARLARNQRVHDATNRINALDNLGLSHYRRADYLRELESAEDPAAVAEKAEREHAANIQKIIKDNEERSRNLASSLDYSSDLDSVRVPRTGTRALAKLLSPDGKATGWTAMLRDHGWASDGRFAVAISEEEKQGLAAMLASQFADAGRGMEVINFARGIAVAGPAHVSGVKEQEGGDKPVAFYRVDVPGGKLVVNARMFRIIQDRHPDAQLLAGSRSRGGPVDMLIWKQGDQPVGMLMSIENV